MRDIALLALFSLCFFADVRGDNDIPKDSSARGDSDDVATPGDFNSSLKFPEFITEGKKLVLSLYTDCEKVRHNGNIQRASPREAPSSDMTKKQEWKTRVNLDKISFENCTYVCQPSETSALVRRLPSGTPCEKGKQCSDQGECRTSLPEGC
uniref:Secreted salivary protein Salp15 n=1 Tax=Ixodes holocyclus TaxID=65647 RepID=A0A1S5R124_IXOHO|nr:secreted salivary protein Salp15 [Ixodes holocyclus]